MEDTSKDILIEKMLDKPGTLTAEELEVIVSDSRLRDLYEMSARVAGGLCTMPDVDVDAEWNRLRAKIAGRSMRRRPRGFRAAVAAAVAAMLAGGSAMIYRDMSDKDVSEELPYIAQTAEPDMSEMSSADIEEYVRICEARIDNEASMALSEVYLAEYSETLEIVSELRECGVLTDDNPFVRYLNEININQITML